MDGIRLWPVLMTTAAMVVGVIPLLVASGAGAASRFNIGLVVTSGMLIGTLFTMFVVSATQQSDVGAQPRPAPTKIVPAAAPAELVGLTQVGSLIPERGFVDDPMASTRFRYVASWCRGRR